MLSYKSKIFEFTGYNDFEIIDIIIFKIDTVVSCFIPPIEIKILINHDAIRWTK